VLQCVIEVGEDDIATQYEVEGARGDCDADILKTQLGSLLELRAHDEILVVSHEGSISEVARYFTYAAGPIPRHAGSFQQVWVRIRRGYRYSQSGKPMAQL
jgi:hypothetical protein